MSERFLVTGALGCIGAWTLRHLVREGVPVVAFDQATDRRRLELIAAPDEIAAVTFVRGDITDLAAVETVLDEHGSECRTKAVAGPVELLIGFE